MTVRNRVADARLIRVERALQKAENRLDAAIHRQDIEGETSDLTQLHDEVRALVGKAIHLYPVSDAGLASKIRMALKYHELAEVGRSLVHSLVEALHSKGRRRR